MIVADYIITTESTCDIAPRILKEWDVRFSCFSFSFEDEPEVQREDISMSAPEFYANMRAGRMVKTSAANSSAVESTFRSILKEGKDILHLGFSSALSSTFDTTCFVAKELLEEFPERKIYLVDTLAQSAGLGLLIKKTVDRKNAGASIEEARDYAESEKLHIAHWFSVDDIKYLKRGGRLSTASAAVATVLNIKPILHTDNNGKLVAVGKARGIKAAVQTLLDKYDELALTPGKGTVFFCHADCPEYAELLRKGLREKYGMEDFLTTDVGPVIGSHIGPGTYSLFFEAKER
ncbi:MAG: DegV family protein [Eubacteriales bacterium]|nr:DegV family protein [Candidatus Hippenecus merdae]MDO4809988.1 DegV family protein [Eubacteriales bacterium]